MKILVIGGTRQLGHHLVLKLHQAGHQMTVLSRRDVSFPEGIGKVLAERQQGLAAIKGIAFDAVIDFIAFNDGDVADIADAGLSCSTYVLISTTWLLRGAPGADIGQPIPACSDTALAQLPHITRNYLTGKLAAEARVLASRSQPAAILRLPIFLGANDHTGRVNFYRSRVEDGHPVICVDGGKNLAHLAWNEEVADAITAWLPFATERPVWNGLSEPISPHRFISLLDASQPPRLVDVPSSVLQKALPEYLAAEPLWREIPISGYEASSIFQRLGRRPAPPEHWVPMAGGRKDPHYEALRPREIEFLRNFHAR